MASWGAAPLPREGDPGSSPPASPMMEDTGPEGHRAPWGGTPTSDPKGDCDFRTASPGPGSWGGLPSQRKPLWGLCLRKREENAARSIELCAV